MVSTTIYPPLKTNQGSQDHYRAVPPGIEATRIPFVVSIDAQIAAPPGSGIVNEALSPQELSDSGLSAFKNLMAQPVPER